MFVGTSYFPIKHKHKMAYYVEYNDQDYGFELFLIVLRGSDKSNLEVSHHLLSS